MTADPAPQGMARRLAQSALWPLRRVLDPRFADTARRIDYTRDTLAGSNEALERRTERLEELMGAVVATSTESLAFLGRDIRDLDAATAGLAARLELLERGVAEIQESLGTVGFSRRVDALIEGGVGELDVHASRLIDFAAGHRGFAAQSGLWLNPAISVEHREGEVRLGGVNERVLEVPWAFQSLGAVPLPARILDVGSLESSVAFSLATLGYEVTALDLRPYPFEHPNLEVATARIEDFDPGEARYDAVCCISTVEHIGLGWYGEEAQESTADRDAMRKLLRLVKPGGRLVLTVPFGTRSVDAVQRTYDDESLDELVAGWDVLERRVMARVGESMWAEGRPEPGRAGVALVLGQRPDET